ncbi:hypothetical protein BRC71_06320 [Halobacteriales archaeon QH_7_65_31]|nr:MAG: hypothetical protein BRC71_06320 [Halobacteriales archaeon QH_7_65_31]
MGAVSDEDVITTYQNAPSVALKPTPMLEISPERGQFYRFHNVTWNGHTGLPVYMDLNAADGSDLPTTTLVVFEFQSSNGDDYHRVAVPLKRINFFNKYGVEEQSDQDRRHNALIPLKYPEASAQSGLRDHLDVRDVDSFTVSIISSKAVDWDQSEFLFEDDAVDQYSRE